MAIILYDLCGADEAVRFSPYCWRAKLALAIKGVAYETEPTPFTAIPVVAGGVTKTVPLIDDDGVLVSDSFAIAVHLDAAYPDAPELFAGESGIAAARFLESWAFLAVHPIIMRMIVKSIHDALGEADQAYFRPSREARVGAPLEEFQTGVEANTEALSRALEPLRRTLAHHAWLAGDRPGFADCIPFGTLMWLNTINGSLPLAGDDPLRSWLDRCLGLRGGMPAAA